MITLGGLGVTAAWGLFRAWVRLRGSAVKTPDTYRQIAEHEVALNGTPFAPVRLLVIASGLMLLFGLGLTGCAALRDRSAVVEADRLRSEARQTMNELATLRTQAATYRGSLGVCEAHRGASEAMLQDVNADRAAERAACIARIETAASQARRQAEARAAARIERMRNEQAAVERGDQPRRPVGDRVRELAAPAGTYASPAGDHSGAGAAAHSNPAELP
jgi:hypothetical protein